MLQLFVSIIVALIPMNLNRQQRASQLAIVCVFRLQQPCTNYPVRLEGAAGEGGSFGQEHSAVRQRSPHNNVK